MAYSELPDLEAVAGRALRAADICDERVYSSIPKNPTYPLATVVRTGGVPRVKQRLDQARIQVSVWSDSKSEARDEAEAARRALHEMEGTVFTEEEAYITGVEDAIGLTSLDDPDNGKRRYVFSVLIFAHHVTVTPAP